MDMYMITFYTCIIYEKLSHNHILFKHFFLNTQVKVITRYSDLIIIFFIFSLTFP